MSIFVTAIYKGLLSSPTLSPAAQQQILRYSVDSKAYELIESLLEHPNLTKEVDALIGEVPASRVKSAWLRRPGRSAKELEALVASYKSQSVLLDLVRTAGMPSELYLAVVNKTDKKAVLVEVATCDHIDKSVKTAAVLRLAKVLPEDPAPTKQASLTEFYQIVQRYPELAESVATTTKNIPLALAALGLSLIHISEPTRPY